MLLVWCVSIRKIRVVQSSWTPTIPSKFPPMLKTFSIQTLGCRVNQYESDQLAALLRSRGLTQVDTGADLRVVNTCSVTIQAASKSRQTVRRAVRLPVLQEVEGGEWGVESEHLTPHSQFQTPRTLAS